MIIAAIDPGTTESGILFWDTEKQRPTYFGKRPNDVIESIVSDGNFTILVCEKILSFGMIAGAELFETCYFTGRLSVLCPTPFERVGRKTVAAHHCGDAKAKDKNIRAALIERFGPQSTKVDLHNGKKGRAAYEIVPGVLHGIADDVWSALAIAIWKMDQLDPTQGLGGRNG